MSAEWEKTITDAPAAAPATSSTGSWLDTIQDAPKENLSNAAEAAVLGGGQGTFGGFGDELLGAINTAREVIGGDGKVSDIPKIYQRERDTARQAMNQVKDEHPIVYNGSEIGGAVLGPGKLAKGATGAMALGATMGLGNSEADLVNGDVGRAALDTGVGAGAAYLGDKAIRASAPYIGKALNSAGSKSAEVMDFLSKKLGTAAEDLGVAHLRPTAAKVQELGRDRLRDISREALDSQGIKFGAKAEDTAARLADLKDAAGAVKGDIVNSSNAEIDPVAIAQRFDDEVISPLRGTAENNSIVRNLEAKKEAFLQKYAPGYSPNASRAPGSPTVISRRSEFIPETPKTDFSKGMGEVTHDMQLDMGVGKPLQVEGVQPVYQTPDPSAPYKVDSRTGLPIKRIAERRLEAIPEIQAMTPQQLEAEKTAVQQNINWRSDSNAKIGAQRDWARVLKEGTEEAIPDPAFGAAKRSYGNLSNAQEMAERTAGVRSGGLTGQLTDLEIAAEAAKAGMKGNPIGVPIVAARAISKGRIASSTAVTLDTVSKLLSSTPEALGKFAPLLQNASQRGSSALATTNFLLQQQSPEFQELLKKVAENPDGGDERDIARNR